MIAYYRTYALPWEVGLEEDQRLRELLKRSAIAAVVLTILFSLLPLPELARDEVEEVPERFAKLLLEKPKPPPPPPPVVQQPEPEPDTLKPEPEPEKVGESKPEPKP